MTSEGRNSAGTSGRSRAVSWIIAANVLLVLVVALFLPRTKKAVSGNGKGNENGDLNSSDAIDGSLRTDTAAANPKIFRTIADRKAAAHRKTADEIVADKVRQFGRKRRAIAERIAKRLNRELPSEVDAFFKAVDAGDWDELHSIFNDLATHAHQYTYSKGDRPEQDPFWESVLDTFGVTAEAHKWPAQQLLDYGNSVLGSLQPGMVYVGGTDAGRFVPELLNDTSDDPHIMLTQNALADGMYLDYLREEYGDQLNTLSPENLQAAFQQYTADAQRRLQHDLDFPDEPKQVLPGENAQMVDGKFQISGVASVMAINQLMVQTLMQNNPNLSFAIQESYPLATTYGAALPLGPLMELGAQSDQTTFTADLASQSVAYWQSAAQTLMDDPGAADSSTTMNVYSHDVNATGNLLAANDFIDQAEQAYTLASRLNPGNPDPINGLAQLLTQTGHAEQAQELVNEFVSQFPDQKSAMQEPLWAIVGTKTAGH